MLEALLGCRLASSYIVAANSYIQEGSDLPYTEPLQHSPLSLLAPGGRLLSSGLRREPAPLPMPYSQFAP